MLIKLFLSGSFLVFCLLIQQESHAQSQTSTNKELEEAIATLRHTNSDKLTDAEKELKGKQIDQAWKLIESLGAKGILRLKQEINKVESDNEKDDFFKLNASALLWQIGRLNEAEEITKIWNSTPLAVQYNYVFYVAIDAARTQDPRALPLLRAVLKDDKGQVYFPIHVMRVVWPLTHEFLWGVYGPKAFPALHEVLEKSNDAVELRSAMILLSQAQYLKALPIIRQAARSAQDDIRRTAIQSLGRYGHPQDYDFLLAGLRSNDTKEQWSYAFALYEYDDLRAVPHLIQLLHAQDASLRLEVIAALSHLLTPASFEALQEHLLTTTNQQEKEFCREFINNVLDEINLSRIGYSRKPPAEKEALLSELRNRKYTLKKTDNSLTRQQLLDAIKEWKSNNRLSGKYGWVEVKHVLSVATPDDIDPLLEAKASFYQRLSDECLNDVRRVDEMVEQLGRRRYRKGVGIAEKAEGN